MMTIRAAAEITLTDINDAIVQGSEPLNPTDGMLWLDNSQTPNVLKRYDSSSNKWEVQTVSLVDADPEKTAQIDLDSFKNIRYIRLSAGGSTANTGNHWVEVQVFKGATNVALGTNVTSSSTPTNSQTTAVVTDGVIDTDKYVAIATDTTTKKGWIQLDLGQNYEELDKIVFYMYWKDGRTYYNTLVEVSIDGIIWKTVHDSRVTGEFVTSANGFTVPLNPAMASQGNNVTFDSNVTINPDFTLFAGSIDLGNGKFKVDRQGNMTANNAVLTDGSLGIDYEVVAVAPNIKANGTMKIQKGAFLTDDTFTQGGTKYTRSIQLNGNGLLTSIRAGSAAAAVINIDPMAGISMNGANQNLQIGNLQLNNAHSIGMADAQKLYFNQGVGGSPRIDIACKSVDTNSLRSLKENFTEVDPEEALEEILKTDVVTYNFKDDDVNEKHTTLIIDDMPEEDTHYYTPKAFLASGGEGRDDGSIIGYLMLSIKKLKQEIDELKAKIE
ncbi:discoidin domain-containing protein [Listeria monocytogenes]|uniref:discoidin domain-containing protein n=1 Tax=Listeria monocytogenes TaxID=1639 RepID=UPI001F5638C1|nr:discoidin domain-containing protein [Listeria monocytogenes]